MPLEINKQTVLVVLAGIALAAWLGSMVLNRRLSIRGALLPALAALLAISALVSTRLSLGGFQSWIGQANQEYTSFLTIVMLLVVFLVLMNIGDREEIWRGSVLAMLLSSALAGILAIPGFLGFPLVPVEQFSAPGFNLVGTVNALASFMIIVTFIGIAAWSAPDGGRGSVLPEGGLGSLARVLVVLNAAMALFLAFAVDFWLLWVLAIAGSVLSVGFIFLYKGTAPVPKARLALPILVLLLSLVMLFVRTPVRLNVPVVVSPSYGASWQIASGALSVGAPQLFFGTGPGTYLFDYRRFRPIEVNSTLFWSVGFDRAKSHAITSLATMGMIGFLLVVAMGCVLAWRATSRLIAGKGGANAHPAYVLFVGWALLALHHLLYASNMTMSFLFWGLSGLLAAHVIDRVRSYGFASSPRSAALAVFGYVLVSVGVLTAIFVSAPRYLADMAFAEAAELSATEGATIDDVTRELRRASDLTLENDDLYLRNLSSALLFDARQTLAAAGEKISPEETREVQQLVAASVTAAKRATDIAPNNVSNWAVRGAIYRDVMPFTQNAEDFAAATLARAISLEPLNPVHHTNLGRVHLAVAARSRVLRASENEEVAKAAAQAEALELARAEESFSNAARVMPANNPYTPAHYYLAVTYERQGRLAESAQRLAALRNANPANIGLSLELSLLLIRLDELDAAKAELERVLTLAPDNSNAMWFLSAVYEVQGNRDKAIELVERVAELNQGNALVERRLEVLRAGGEVAEIPAPVEEGEESAVTVPGGAVTETPDAGLPEAGGASGEETDQTQF